MGPITERARLGLGSLSVVKIKVLAKIKQGQNNSMTTVTPEQVSQLRSELANNPEALEALEVIEEWDGDLADAAESLATRNGIEGVEDNADSRWFADKLRQCRDFICNSKYQNLREKHFPALLPPVAEFFAVLLGCLPGVATIIATPFAIYIMNEGMDKFCNSYDADS